MSLERWPAHIQVAQRLEDAFVELDGCYVLIEAGLVQAIPKAWRGIKRELAQFRGDGGRRRSWKRMVERDLPIDSVGRSLAERRLAEGQCLAQLWRGRGRHAVRRVH
jgi:hypothetical protein